MTYRELLAEVRKPGDLRADVLGPDQLSVRVVKSDVVRELEWRADHAGMDAESGFQVIDTNVGRVLTGADPVA